MKQKLTELKIKIDKLASTVEISTLLSKNDRTGSCGQDGRIGRNPSLPPQPKGG